MTVNKFISAVIVLTADSANFKILIYRLHYYYFIIIIIIIIKHI